MPESWPGGIFATDAPTHCVICGFELDPEDVGHDSCEGCRSERQKQNPHSREDE